MRTILLLIVFAFSLSSSKAQSNVLKNYIAEGLESNIALKQENLELEKAMKSIDIARANLYPKIAFAPTYSLAAGGRRLEFPIGDLLNPVYNTLNKLTQAGTFPQVENVNELLAPNNFQDTKISFQYPLFNSDIKQNIVIQKELLNTEYAKKKYLEYELTHNIEIAYYQYLQALEAIKIYEQSMGLLVDFVKLNQKLLDNKVILKDVLLTAEYEVTKLEQQVSTATKNAELAKSYFNFLLNKPLESKIDIESFLNSDVPVIPNLQTLQQIALEKRPEFEQLSGGINISNATILLQEKNAILPQFYFGGNAGFQGFGYDFSNQAYLVAQVGMQWDIFHGKEKKHKIQQSKINKSIIELKVEEVKNQISLQVKQNYLELHNSLKTVETFKGAMDKTGKILEIINSRYKNGAAILVEVNKAQNDDLLAKLSELLARQDAWVKYATLKKSCGIE